MSVLIQPFVPATLAKGVLFSREPTSSETDTVFIDAQRPTSAHTFSWRSDQLGSKFPLSEEKISELIKLAKTIESKYFPRGVDIEWVWSEHGLRIVQARPIVFRKIEKKVFPSASLFSPLEESEFKEWAWDFSHNPDPMSPAQQALVARQSERGYPAKSIAGYLYTPVQDKRIATTSAKDVHDLFFEQALPMADNLLRENESQNAPTVASALDVYDQIFDLYFSTIAPALQSLKQNTSDKSIEEFHFSYSMRPSDAELRALSPVWDVAFPTFAEAKIPFQPTPHERRPRTTTDFVRDLLELDDRLFYRAQWAVRRALLAMAKENQIVPDDLFFCESPLKEELLPEKILSEAEINRTRFKEARQLQMPTHFPQRSNDQPQYKSVYKGLGWGGRVAGRTCKLVEGAIKGSGSILLAVDVPPSMLAAGLRFTGVITESGGPLSHGATIARELGIPCVVSCKDAWRTIPANAAVLVDGAAGTVVVHD